MNNHSFNQPINTRFDVSDNYGYYGDVGSTYTAWDVGNVTSLYRMFRMHKTQSSFNQPLNNWDVGNVTDGGLDCSTAGVEDENLLTITIYPNPVKDKLYIQDLSNTSKVLIYNVLGKLVLSETTKSEIDVDNLQSGIYIIKIVDEQKEIIRKFIKN